MPALSVGGGRIGRLHSYREERSSQRDHLLVVGDDQQVVYFRTRCRWLSSHVIRQPKWSRHLQHSHLALTRWSERHDPISQGVMSSPSTDMITPTVFFKLLYTILFYLKGVTRRWMRVNYAEDNNR